MNLQLVYRYILSLSKNENMFYEKNTKQNKRTKDKKREKGRESNPGPSTCRVNEFSIAPRQPPLSIAFNYKLIVFNSFAHEILPVDAV